MTEYILSQAVTIVLFVIFIVVLARRAVRREREYVDRVLHDRQIAAERFDREAAARAAAIPRIDIAADLAPALARLAAVPALPDPMILRTITDEAIKRLQDALGQTEGMEGSVEGTAPDEGHSKGKEGGLVSKKNPAKEVDSPHAVRTRRRMKFAYGEAKTAIVSDRQIASVARRDDVAPEEREAELEKFALAYSVLTSWLRTKAREFGCGQLVELILEHCGPPHPDRGAAPTTVDLSLSLIDQLASLIEARGVLETLPFPLKLPFGTYRITKARSAARLGMVIIIQFIHDYIKNLSPTEDALMTDTIQASAPKIIASLFDLTRDIRSREIVEKAVEAIRGKPGSSETPAASE
jgi:hypothetical protein